MRLSFDWLSDYVDLDGLSAQEVAEHLTMGAFEVEEVSKVGPDIEGPLVVGEIVEINPHPNADKIRLTKVKISAEDPPVDIVCGADNIIVGQHVPVALPGARVINRHDGSQLHIKSSKIRGAVSQGMLCSPPELGIVTGEPEGILILYGAGVLGGDVRAMLRLYPDWVLNIGTRSNRGDALSVLGMAREVSALLKRPMKSPRWHLPEPDLTSPMLDVAIESQEDCPFFSIRIIEGLTIGPTPLRIVRRLEALGLRSVNNVVDITNYVLHELGQPLHAYDFDRIAGQSLSVRRAKPGEVLTTLDGKTRTLSSEILVIADAKGPTGIAGIMGGQPSEITSETTLIALEAATFHPARVRRGSRLLGLSSDSSLLFERGVDSCLTRAASDRAAALILESSAGGLLGNIASLGDDQVKPTSVKLRLSRLSRLTEIQLDAHAVKALLEPLGIESEIHQDESLTASIPSFRQRDLTREIDLIEEVCRLWGYDRIPSSMPFNTMAPDLPDDTDRLLREALSGQGLNETWTSSLVSSEEIDRQQKAVRVLNPLSEDHQVMRMSLLPGLVKAAVYNQDRGAKDIWLFELGRTYESVADGLPAANEPCPRSGVTGAQEELRVAGIMSGPNQLTDWIQISESLPDSGFFLVKGTVQGLLDRLSISDCQFSSPPGSSLPKWFHPGRSACLQKRGDPDTFIGWLGEIHPYQKDKLGLRQSACLFELLVGPLSLMRKEERFQEFFATPELVRDLTIDLPRQVSHQSVTAVLVKSGGMELKKVDLVSVFELAAGGKSLCYRLTFQDQKTTLTAEQVEERLAHIRSCLIKELNCAFRT